MNPAIILRLLLPELLALLSLSVKNPASVATELDTISAIRDNCTAILVANGRQ